MRNQAILNNSHDILGVWDTFPTWINCNRAKSGAFCYAAKPFDLSFNGMPTITVEMSGPAGIIALYKCNVIEVCDGGKDWLVFSPLVVVWEQDRQMRGPEMGRIMIEHFVEAVRVFREERGAWSHAILIASGNLTVAKGGKPFFEGIGWEIVYPELREPARLYDGAEAMAAPLDTVAAQIEAAIAPVRAAGRLDSGPVSFALLPLSGGGRVGTSQHDLGRHCS
jgi:hypothetical protein